MRKILQIILIVVIVPVGGCLAETEKTDYQKNVKKLEQSCAALTENDEHGRVWEAIIGQYLGSKSKTSVTPSGVTNPSVNHKLILKNKQVENVIYFGAPAAKFYEVQNFHSYLVSIFGENAVENKADTTSHFGICAYKNSQGTDIGKFKSLVKIGG